ncbi:TPA: 50S ribosomal protein L31 [Candidatus Dependentiae bacterium]|nr:MAG: 50S ribosomal protein L31 [candidate division TM6 bacterium GW2011_GWE2_31_21]KKP53182.1 MAG: 50S ribosomal protein L31 [candidate division TM6 bacterium GW2011_GWF2_33_332]HBS48000.1 50S ribosomal protein L31 [Candidatus Dependentiae bacterium]HBZ73396.1 50S ribosomal protein L31 [Candidatus Dependentiae bacterium]
MKKDIHPTTHKVLAQCVCGNAFETYSTKESIRVDICSSCHPFCTGTQKFIDEAGRIEKFQNRYNKKTKK